MLILFVYLLDFGEMSMAYMTKQWLQAKTERNRVYLPTDVSVQTKIVSNGAQIEFYLANSDGDYHVLILSCDELIDDIIASYLRASNDSQILEEVAQIALNPLSNSELISFLTRFLAEYSKLNSSEPRKI